MRMRILLLWVMALFMIGVFQGMARATTFTVNTTDDEVDTACNEFHCSLREAINAANNSAGLDSIEFDIPGAGPHTIQPESELPYVTDAVVIDGYTQPGASPNTNPVGQGLNGVLRIVIDGSNTGFAYAGLFILAGNCTIRGLVVSGFNLNGIWLDDVEGVVIEGNYVGTDVQGMTVLSNGLHGISISVSSNNRIGGTTPAARNLISGNGGAGIMSGSTGNVVQGNLIGTDKNGTGELGNEGYGVIEYGQENTIGGDVPGARNVISGNSSNGVGINNSDNVVQGNFIGTDITGTLNLGNSRNGLMLIGTTEQSVMNNTIGGNVAEARNIISGNGESGIVLENQEVSGNIVQGNFIGTQVDGISPLPNTAHGIYLENLTHDNTIGGTSVGSGNTIAYNGSTGISLYRGTLYAGTNNAILSNLIFSNGELGIDLPFTGVNPNDEGDGDTGANNLQNFPGLTVATTDAVQGTLNSSGDTEFRLEFFSNSECDPSGYGEGEAFLGSEYVTTDGNGNKSFTFSFDEPLALGLFITATATDPDGNTSEFSECAQIREPCVITVISPDGGETWNAGESETITWTSDETSGFIDIEYSTDAGDVWELVSESTEDDGSSEWTVPGTPSEYCLVRICDAQEGTCCDQSDDLFTIHTDCDFAITDIIVPTLVSVGYTTAIQVAITNLSLMDMSLGDAYLDILDESGESLTGNDPSLMDPIFQDPYFLFPTGETLDAFQYDWRPTEAGDFYIRVFLAFECDTNAVNDTMTVGLVTVSEQGTAYIGNFIPYSPERYTIPAEHNAGPASRYTIPSDMTGATLHTILVVADADCTSVVSSSDWVGAGEMDQAEKSQFSPFWVYVFEPGENDSTFGEELIEPFEFYPDSVDEDGRIVIDLTQRWDFENLTDLTGDFWVHLRATEQTHFHFVAGPALPDTGTARNWYFVWETPRRDRDRIGGSCPPPGWMNPFDKGWKELIGLDFSLCLQDRGDVNNDGMVNVLDVMAVVNHILGLVPITDDETLCRADCNGDGGINIVDALGIVNVILGIGECGP